MSCNLPPEQDTEWARAFIWTANAIGFTYNLPQIVHTIRTKKTADISGLFLILRLVSSSMWVFYSSYFFMYDVLISWLITMGSNLVIMYYKYVYRPPVVQLVQNEIPQKPIDTISHPDDYEVIILKGEDGI